MQEQSVFGPAGARRMWVGVTTIITSLGLTLAASAGPDCCGEADAGACDAPNGTPCCDDAECCDVICGLDPFCCETEWDDICAEAALEECFQPEGACCIDGACQILNANECNAADGVYLGDDVPCDAGFCDGANDPCDGALPIADGSTLYSTVLATTDGLAHADCQFDGQTYEDVWYSYTASCTGPLTVSTCDNADYDTDLVVYTGCDPRDCPRNDDDLLGCNDDMAPCSGFSSELTVDVIVGQCYSIRVGGWNADDRGIGTLTLTCESSCPCVWDLDGNCDVDAADLAALLASWNDPYGPSDLAALLAEWNCNGG